MNQPKAVSRYAMRKSTSLAYEIDENELVASLRRNRFLTGQWEEASNTGNYVDAVLFFQTCFF